MAAQQLEPARARAQASLEKAIEASGIDPADEPSVGWGWHGQATKTFQIAGWFFALFLLLLIFDNIETATATIFLCVSAGVVVFFLLTDLYRRHNKWHR